MEQFFGARSSAKEYKISAHKDVVTRTHLRFLVEMVMLTTSRPTYLGELREYICGLHRGSMFLGLHYFSIIYSRKSNKLTPFLEKPNLPLSWLFCSKKDFPLLIHLSSSRQLQQTGVVPLQQFIKKPKGTVAQCTWLSISKAKRKSSGERRSRLQNWIDRIQKRKFVIRIQSQNFQTQTSISQKSSSLNNRRSNNLSHLLCSLFQQQILIYLFYAVPVPIYSAV